MEKKLFVNLKVYVQRKCQLIFEKCKFELTWGRVETLNKEKRLIETDFQEDSNIIRKKWTRYLMNQQGQLLTWKLGHHTQPNQII